MVEPPMVVFKNKNSGTFLLQFLQERGGGGLGYAFWMSSLNSYSLETSSEKNITQQVLKAAIWWHAKKTPYLMIRVHDPCDHSHWTHQQLQHPCPLKYAAGTPAATPSVSWSDPTVVSMMVCRCSPGARVRAHHLTDPLHQLSGYLWGHPSIPQEEQWEDKPSTSCYLNLDTLHRQVRCLLPGTWSIPGGLSPSSPPELAQWHRCTARPRNPAATWSTREMQPQRQRAGERD